MTVGEIKNILDEYKDETEINTMAMDEEGNLVSYDFDEVTIYSPALSSEALQENILTLCLVKRD